MEAQQREAWSEKCERMAAALARGESRTDWRLVAQELATVSSELVAWIKNRRPEDRVLSDDDADRIGRNCVRRVREAVAKVWRLSEEST
jgi:hypothetical protein